MTSFLWGVLVAIAVWLGNRIVQRLLDKTVGEHVDNNVDIVIKSGEFFRKE